MSPAAALLGGSGRAKSATWRADLGVVPAELGGEQLGDVGRGGLGGRARSNRWARVRRLSTSSSVVAISWRAA